MALSSDIFKSVLIQDVSPSSLLDHLFSRPDNGLLRRAKRKLYDSQSGRWRTRTRHTRHSDPPVLPDQRILDFLDRLCQQLSPTTKATKGKYSQDLNRAWTKVSPETALLDEFAAEHFHTLILRDTASDDCGWSSVLCHLELCAKDLASTSEVDEEIILARLLHGADKVFLHQPLRHHLLSVQWYEASEAIRVTVFDRRGILISGPVNTHEEPDILLHLLAGLWTYPSSSLGIYYDSEPTELRIAGVEYQVTGMKVHVRSLLGRGTVTFDAEDDDGELYAIKYCWQTRVTVSREMQVLEQIRGVQGVPDIVARENACYEKGAKMSTDWLRSFLPRDQGRTDDGTGLVMTSTVMTPRASPLSSVTDPKDVLLVFIDCIRAHERLVKRGVLHNDISIHNMMVAPSPDEDVAQTDQSTKPRGILIDFDRALLIDEREDSGEHFTGGTPMFASVDLLRRLNLEDQPKQSQVPAIRHDLESFLYCLIFHCIPSPLPPVIQACFREVSAQKAPAGNPAHTIYGFEAKLRTMSSDELFASDVLSAFVPQYDGLKRCADKLRKCFFRDGGYVADVDGVTHENVVGVLANGLRELELAANVTASNGGTNAIEACPPALRRKAGQRSKRQALDDLDTPGQDGEVVETRNRNKKRRR